MTSTRRSHQNHSIYYNKLFVLRLTQVPEWSSCFQRRLWTTSASFENVRSQASMSVRRGGRPVPSAWPAAVNLQNSAAAACGWAAAAAVWSVRSLAPVIGLVLTRSTGPARTVAATQRASSGAAGIVRGSVSLLQPAPPIRGGILVPPVAWFPAAVAATPAPAALLASISARAVSASAFNTHTRTNQEPP